MQHPITYKDPTHLRLHKLQSLIPAPDKNSPEWIAFVDSVQNSGGPIHPLLITKDGQIMDGGWRWRAVKQLALGEVPCIVRDESEAAALIVESLLHRKQMTRGAAVYLALGLMEDFIESAESRRLANLRNKVKTREIPLKSPKSSNSTSEDSIQALCQRWGVGKDTFHRARQVREVFTKDAAARAEWEPRLLSGEKNLWNVLSAIGGGGADQSKRDAGVVSAQLELFTESFSDLKKAAFGWKKFEADQRQKVLSSWRATVKAMPGDLRDALAQALEEAD